MIKKEKALRWFLPGALLLSVLTGPLASAGDDTLVEERLRLLNLVEAEKPEAVTALKEALNDERSMMNLTAVHLALEMGADGIEAIEKALEHRAVEVRRKAMLGLARMGMINRYWPVILMDEHDAIRLEVQFNLLKNHPLPEGETWEGLLEEMARMYDQAPPARRRHVVELFAGFEELTPQARSVLIMATGDHDDSIRRPAFEGILRHVERDWQEARDLMVLARSDAQENIRRIGLEIKWKLFEVGQVRLPREGWRFRKDPAETGRALQWYDPGHDDSRWREDVLIESSWKNFIEQDYDGAAWYRRDLEVPGFTRWDRALLHFEGVDEQAWVWLNGHYAGSHEMGPEGWDVPFMLDVTGLVKPGETNHIAVKVANTTAGAGIWRPVRLRVLDSTRLEVPRRQEDR